MINKEKELLGIVKKLTIQLDFMARQLDEIEKKLDSAFAQPLENVPEVAEQEITKSVQDVAKEMQRVTPIEQLPKSGNVRDKRDQKRKRATSLKLAEQIVGKVDLK